MQRLKFNRFYFLLLCITALSLHSCFPEFPEEVAVAYKDLPDQLDYNLHVKPVLSDKCFACHGPDKAKQKAGLRLDIPEVAFASLPENPGKVAFGKLVGNNPYHLKGTTINEMKDYGFAGQKGPDSASWKTMNTYSVDGVLYMVVTRCLYPEQSGDSKNRHVFRNSSIIKSTDKGLTWTRSESENYKNPMFPGLRFGAPYFVWYGKDGEASVDNADKYVYAVSNNGHFEDGDNYIIGRVLRSRLSNLDAKDWQFFSGGDGMQDKNWSSDMNKTKPVLEDSMNCSMTGTLSTVPLSNEPQKSYK